MSTDEKSLHDNVIVMPDIYAERYSVEESPAEVIEMSTLEDDEPVGFDPYDTARLYKK